MSDTLPAAAPVKYPAVDAARLPVAAARPPRQPRRPSGKDAPTGEEASGPRAKGRPKDTGQDDRRARTIEALAIAALLTVAGQSEAEPDPMRGADLFARHCAMCHGAWATGDGPLAPTLTIQPTDLTGLGRGDAFPVLRVVMRIDGRDPLVAHGSPMPVWGDWFEGAQVALRAANGQTILTSAPVADLTAYLATIQR
jgi:mono/diheme cytochrome c family protein